MWKYVMWHNRPGPQFYNSCFSTIYMHKVARNFQILFQNCKTSYVCEYTDDDHKNKNDNIHISKAGQIWSDNTSLTN